ncbi:MAG: cytosol nonspecific dipeptidase [Flavobacteriaceae bacterium]|nr:cytosol nonspecific dipeptidase [Flavobacteriaceae bacterium]|tara:strand:- start:553 stop:2019 length:1467 start_codon:yes stop_codon:yes gene_type:complete
MSVEVSKVEPKEVWKNFVLLNEVPRPSKKEDRVIEFLISFATKNNLLCKQDKVGNLVIVKESTPDMISRETVVLQSHVDMVHEKNNDVEFDFLNSGIKMYVDGDWVKADGTTLGADNGLGVASIMAILESNEISHPKIEALFTIDEETGMTGALNLSDTILTGKILLNLDTEEDDEICVGCAGGIDITMSKNYPLQELNKDDINVKILLNGLTGGHSGAEIHKGLGNSNKILFKLIKKLNSDFDVKISSVDGGGLRNAIPRESSVIISFDEDNLNSFKKIIKNTSQILVDEFKETDDNINLEFELLENRFQTLCTIESEELINAINECPNGVFEMSENIDGLVETSNNLANIKLIEGKLKIQCLTRSSSENSKDKLSKIISKIFENIGCDCKFSGGYPGWEPNLNSVTLKEVKHSYVKLFSSEPKVNVIHAGLECGIIGSHYPEMDMISFGPTILGAHSPDEKASISSTQKFWRFFREILSNIPEKVN